MSEEVVNVDEYEVLAKWQMLKMVFDYFANSNEDQVSLRENRTNFSRIR
jgi:(S)-2-hydroxy-acid oxidase